MKHSQLFQNAVWVKARESEMCPVIRTTFHLASEAVSAKLRILGLGAYVFYVNGKSVTEDLFQPLNSNFGERDFPHGEVMGTRAYVNTYDVTESLKTGKNVIATMLGNGWYDGTFGEKAYGERKLCFLLTVETRDGTVYVRTSEEDRYADSFVKKSDFLKGEVHDYTDWDPRVLDCDYDDSALPHVAVAEPLDTELYESDCPRDKIVAVIEPKAIGKIGGSVVYDAGINLSGVPILRSAGKLGTVRISFAEELTESGDIDARYGAAQAFEAKVGEAPIEIRNMFSWYGFRYFKVEGEAEVVSVLKTHAAVELASSFRSDNETLNWIYATYLNTQCCNLHQGIPSDCPHFERRGYTGDGQLTCRAAMRTLDMHAFYTKWMEDISDCQDRGTGHVQYTAPYTCSGGGPGGWGAAIVILPYEMWKYYGDTSNLKKYYPQMLRYFDFLEAHSENKLVNSDIPGVWCLGDWCTPGPVELPAPFVNNYFYVKSMQMAIEIAEYLGEKDDIAVLEQKIAERKHAIEVAYFNTWDGNYFASRQGGNAFALDIGLGDERTKAHFIEYYDRLGHYDTGIFGTDIVTRLLFEYGRADIALKLLTASEPYGFGKWMKDGATTFHEYWGEGRSHNHPMFGAVVSYFYEYLLGIRQEKGSTAFQRVTVSPVYAEVSGNICGHITTPMGKISVAYGRKNGKLTLSVTIPDRVCASVVTPNGETVSPEKGGTYTFAES